MRFKYLTATMLRKAAERLIENKSYCMCWAIDYVSCYQREVIVEFENVLDEMGVSKSGWLDYQLGTKVVKTNRNQSWCSEEQRFARAFFLHMLADAIAYKEPKKSKFDSSNKPFSENPSEPGVYAVAPILHKYTVHHYSKWDGKKWCLTCDTAEDAKNHQRKSFGIYDGSYSHWINTKLL